MALLLAAAGCTDGDKEATPPRSTTTTTTNTTAPRPLELGRALTPADLGGALPDEGIAVDVEGVGIVLVGLDGHVIGHLPGISKGSHEDAGPGPFNVRDETRDYRLAPGSSALPVVPSSRDFHAHRRFPLAYGTDLVETGDAPGHYWLERGGKTILELGNRMSDEESFGVSADRDVVTFGIGRALDLRSNETRTVPSACEVEDRHGSSWYVSCRPPDGAEPAIDVSVAGAPWKRVVGSVEPAVAGAFQGRWERAFVSPDGKRLLAEWSTECEVARVFLMDVDGGNRRALAEEFHLEDPDLFAQAWGWSKDGRAIVTVQGQPGCASNQPVSGVYLVGQGAPTLLYRVDDWARVNGIAVWAPLLS